MRRSLLLLLALVGLGILAFAVPATRDYMVGWWRDEPFHDGWPLRSWQRALNHGGDRDREQAIAPLRQLAESSPAAVTALAAALRDSSYIVRRRAAEALGELGPKAQAAGPALVACLADPDARVRWRVAQAVGKVPMHGSEAVPALVRLLDHEPDVMTRAAALFSLGSFGDEAAQTLPILAVALQKPGAKEGDPAAAAREALRRLGAAAVPTLIKLCGGGNARGKANAAAVLGAMGSLAATAGPALAQLLTDPDAGVRGQAAAALWQLNFQRDDAAATLLRVINDSDLEAKLEAIAFLGTRGPEAAPLVPALCKCLAGPNEALQRTTALALGKLGAAAKPCLARLEALASNAEAADVQHAARQALDAIRKHP